MVDGRSETFQKQTFMKIFTSLNQFPQSQLVLELNLLDETVLKNIRKFGCISEMSNQKSPSSINGHQVPSPGTEHPKSPMQCHPSTILPINTSISKQISKLKRFLSTLLSFGSDIDITTGEIVKTLVFSLLCNRISIDQFQSKLQQATHFPLKAFVTPFLKATLPLLQQEIILCSQLVHQTPENFLLHNREYLAPFDSNKPENILENAKNFCLDMIINKDLRDPDESKSPEADQSNNMSTKGFSNNKSTSKRSLTLKLESDLCDGKPKEMGFSPKSSSSLPSWRPSLVTVSNISDRFERIESLPQNSSIQSTSSTISWVNSHQNISFIDSISVSKHKSFTDKLHHHWDQLLSHISNFQPTLPYRVTPFQFPTSEFEIISGIDEIIKYQEEHQKSMILQLKNIQETIKKHKEDNKLSDFLHGNGNSNSNDLSNIKRCAAKYYDDAVQEVQRVAQLELRRTIRSLQERTLELVEHEKTRFHFIIEDVRRQCKDEYTRLLLRQDEGPENCHNCGRKASEACSGCQITRYCGRFCQQKDWSKHKNECGQLSAPPSKIMKFEKFEINSNPSKSPIQIDPENLSIKSNTYQCPDLKNILKAVQSPQSSQLADISHKLDNIEEQHTSDDILLIDV